MKRSNSTQEEMDNAQNEMHTDETKKTRMTPPGSTANVREGEERARGTNWGSARFGVHDLRGHEGMIQCVALDKDVVLSASEDTTVKVWDVESLQELCSLRGHGDVVTALVLLSPAESEAVSTALDFKTTKVAVTASLDCHVKVWCVLQGKEIKSIYTFNGITCMDYLAESNLILTGTEGGKVEVFSLITSKQICSEFAYKEAVTSLKIFDKSIYTGSESGVLKMWKLSSSLDLIFSSKQMKPTSKKHFGFGPIVSFVMNDKKLYVGDRKVNIRVLTWSEGNGNSFTIPNYVEDDGVTESLCTVGNYLIAATSCGSINIRELTTGIYLCSLVSENAGRILHAAAVQIGAKLLIATGGEKLKIWNLMGQDESIRTDAEVVHATHFPQLARQGSETDLEVRDKIDQSSESESEQSEAAESDDKPKRWWCNVL